MLRPTNQGSSPLRRRCSPGAILGPATSSAPPPPEWVCPHCGGTHAGLPTDYGWQLPDEVWALDEETRQAHLDWWTEACCHEGRWFIRGVLYLPFTFSDGRWGWGCWAEVSESTARTLWELKDTDGSHLP
ncbi:MAG: DUF2199 domain-containing protein, partial [Pseudobdellovibrionaceae bacterium]